MQLNFNQDLALSYASKSQQARILSEDWAGNNIFCPLCGRLHLKHLAANRPVADFMCDKCGAEFELKSVQRLRFPAIIADGAYDTMIQRITSLNNPHFFFMTYEQTSVSNLCFVPNHFFTPDIIIKRKPLAPTARRAGWVGCNINFSSIPQSGKIPIIRNSQVVDKASVLAEVKRANQLNTPNLVGRGWLMDVLLCLQNIKTETFTLADVYKFTGRLQEKHPNNQHIQAKIRQQLQLLRDKGFITFIKPGVYRFLNILPQ